MLKCVGELIELPASHAKTASHRAPSRYGMFHFSQHIAGARHGDPEIRKDGHQRLDRRLRPSVFGYPGLQLANPFGEWIHIESRRESPLPMTDVQEAVIAQVV